MHPLQKIKSCTLAVCGLFARMKSPGSMMDEVLRQTEDIDNNAILIEAKMKDYRRRCAQLEHANYKLKEEKARLERKLLKLQKGQQKVNESQDVDFFTEDDDKDLSQAVLSSQSQSVQQDSDLSQETVQDSPAQVSAFSKQDD